MTQIDPRDVLIYLNELGYTNISAQQLKEFIIDLKKIIKYETRRRKLIAQSNFSEICPQNHLKTLKTNIFETLYNLPTEASKAKIVNKKDNPPIAIHIKQSKKIIPQHEHCKHIENLDLQTKTTEETEEIHSESDKKINNKTDSSKVDLDTGSSRTSGLRPNSKESRSSSAQNTNFKKSKTQVLRQSTSAKSINKCDPVALYHEYQKKWKNIKFPGKDNHLDLRWAIREKLINGPTVEVIKKPSVKKLPFT